MSNNNLFNINPNRCLELGTNPKRGNLKSLYQKTKGNARRLARLMFKISFNRALAY